MMNKQIFKLVCASFFAGACVLLMLYRAPVFAHPPLDATPIGDDLKDPKYLNKNSCPDDPKNLAVNGGFFGNTHDTAYGPVVDGWDPFIVSSAPPQFRWVNNEGIFKGQSEQVFSSNTFDAGIMQTVNNLQINSYYWFRLGWAPAAKSSSGPNEPSNSVGVQVGFDPFGGRDPNSPNVTWGTAWFNDNKGLNRPQATLVFPARATSVTMFLRAIAKDGSGGENRVWFNAVCMEARPEIPAAAPLAPTATPLPPTATAKPIQPRAPVSPPPTKVAQALATNTPTAIPVTPTPNDTPTPAFTPTALSTPRRARTDATPAPASIDLGAGVATGSGIIFVVGGMLFFVIGILLLKRTS